MTGWVNRFWRHAARAALAGTLALAAAPLAAQSGQDFDLRTRTSPTPQPTVVGPVDPDNPTPRAPRAQPSAAPPLVLPSTAPTATASASPADTTAIPRTTAPRSDASAPATRPAAALPGANEAAPPGQTSGAAPAALPSPAASRTPRAYQPRNLDAVASSTGVGWMLGLGALALMLALGAWLAWSRHFRHRATALPAPEIERPRLAQPPAPQPAANDPQPIAVGAPGLAIALQATRMSATLINTTLSYRLSVTNRGPVALHDVHIAGDMTSAHASRTSEELLGPAGAALPVLHRIAALAPGESVTLGGDIRLPLVSITPIRRGTATFFVPLARLRARGVDPAGATVEGGGTFLVGQEPGASKRLQPFRLDLGPRNYSRLGQHLLPAA